MVETGLRLLCVYVQTRKYKDIGFSDARQESNKRETREVGSGEKWKTDPRMRRSLLFST